MQSIGKKVKFKIIRTKAKSIFTPHLLTICYVYVLKCLNTGKLYIGSTDDLERRLNQYYRKRKNFVLLYYEAYLKEKDARLREKRLKYFGKAYQVLKKE